MTTFADKAIAYYNTLSAPATLPPDIGVMNPFQQPDIQRIVAEFYTKFFSDSNPRIFVLGINPGRFGAGVTGISFTTPQNLRRYCGIDNDLRDTPELSSRFIYQVVDAFGGAQSFYSQFFSHRYFRWRSQKQEKITIFTTTAKRPISFGLPSPTLFEPSCILGLPDT